MLRRNIMQKAVEVPQVRFRDRVVDVPVMLQRQVLRERTFELIVEDTDVLTKLRIQ